ncbi:exosortase Y-associated Wzy-like protein [Pedobacter sp. MW01-1-1]|uniref:exosortase Y-associated Wzy-like protein n=1 Tax=Pedobacter sp. MW01-1-1 TaxID=3383027 RepID=UPI003FEDEAA3
MDQSGDRIKAIIPLYIPVILAFLLADLPIASYFIAWLGSIFIFYWTWFSPAAYYHNDLPIYKQIMRPIFLTQFIFAGFMCCTSIFYFLDHLGYRYFTLVENGLQFQDAHRTAIIAQCQRISLLAHAAFTTGIILKLSKKPVEIRNIMVFAGHNYLIKLSIISYAIGWICNYIPGLNQIALPITTLGVSCGAVLFVVGFVLKKLNYFLVGSGIFLSAFLGATLSGYKEPIIINFILLICLFLPYYKKTIIWISAPLLYLLLYFLPTYNSVVRESWSGNVSATDARSEAIETIFNEENEEKIDDTNWTFLTNRLSEIDMFTDFVEYVPAHHPFYGFEIINQSIEALIPRIFWPAKPNMEIISMERVYESGAVNRFSNVSAKTRPVVDAYLSFGLPSVFIIMLLYGMLMQIACNLGERYFGGYELGCVIVFNSLFQQMWRGNNFEFMFNNIFYAFILLFILSKLLIALKVIMPRFKTKED